MPLACPGGSHCRAASAGSPRRPRRSASAAYSSQACTPAAAAVAVAPQVRLVRRAAGPGARPPAPPATSRRPRARPAPAARRPGPRSRCARRTAPRSTQLGVHDRGHQQRRRRRSATSAAAPTPRSRVGGLGVPRAGRAARRRREPAAASAWSRASACSGERPSAGTSASSSVDTRTAACGDLVAGARRAPRRATTPSPPAPRWRARRAAGTRRSVSGEVRRRPRSRSITSMPSRAAANADGTPSRDTSAGKGIRGSLAEG